MKFHLYHPLSVCDCALYLYTDRLLRLRRSQPASDLFWPRARSKATKARRESVSISFEVANDFEAESLASAGGATAF